MQGDECKKLLDNGQFIVLYKNPLGSYTAVAFVNEEPVFEYIQDAVDTLDDFSHQITDHFEPTKALHALTEKMLGTGDYANWGEVKKKYGDSE